MIFDPKIGALYRNDGVFLKTVHCPIALRIQDLTVLPDGSPDRHCHSCGTTISCIDDMTDSDVEKALSKNRSLCVFATGAAKHIVVLSPIGKRASADETLVKVQTARDPDSMDDAYARGFRLVVLRAEDSGEIGTKYIVFQHNVTGELWWSGDLRVDTPDKGKRSDWTMIADWFYHRPDRPFPLAAYLVPRGLKRGQRVLLEDVIEDVRVEYWNQGDADRLISCVAVWNGDSFELQPPAAEPTVIG